MAESTETVDSPARDPGLYTDIAEEIEVKNRL